MPILRIERPPQPVRVQPIPSKTQPMLPRPTVEEVPSCGYGMGISGRRKSLTLETRGQSLSSARLRASCASRGSPAYLVFPDYLLPAGSEQGRVNRPVSIFLV